jgi:enamine deaminase RidA (YjgF/YER057c/UK114 family)
MTEIQLLRPEGLVASPAFSHVAVVRPGATTVYVGGQNAVDQNGELVGGTDVAAQTRQVMANLATALQAAGAGIEHLVSVLVMLVEGVDVQAAYGRSGHAWLREGPSARHRGDCVGTRCPRCDGGGVRNRGNAKSRPYRLKVHAQ